MIRLKISDKNKPIERIKNPHAKKNHVCMAAVLLISKMSFSAIVSMDGLDFIAMYLIQGMDKKSRMHIFRIVDSFLTPDFRVYGEFEQILKHPQN